MKPQDIDIDIQSISPHDLKNYELIDIREEREIQEWPPLRPCRHVPFSQFPLNVNELDKKTPYLLYCAMGGRSHYMAEALVAQGYTAYSVNQGIGALNSYLQTLPS